MSKAGKVILKLCGIVGVGSLCAMPATDIVRRALRFTTLDSPEVLITSTFFAAVFVGVSVVIWHADRIG